MLYEILGLINRKTLPAVDFVFGQWVGLFLVNWNWLAPTVV